MRKVIIALLILLLIPGGALAIYVGLHEFNAIFPTTLLCGRVISRSDNAIEMAAKSINKELLEGLSPAEYANKCDNCSASLHKDLHNNWMVSMTFPDRCGGSVEVVVGVMVCGGNSWILGAMPSRAFPGFPESDGCTTCTDLRMPREPGCQSR